MTSFDAALRPVRALAPDESHRVHVTAMGITRLVAAEAQAQGFQPDAPEVDEIHDLVLRMPHHERVLRLHDLGGTTHDLWMGLKDALDTDAAQRGGPNQGGHHA
jgi:hypothetical protein